MKKYVKPDLYYENFELSQHIAACAGKLNNGEYDCEFLVDGAISLFLGESCTVTDFDDYNQIYCVYQSTSGISLFSS